MRKTLSERSSLAKLHFDSFPATGVVKPGRDDDHPAAAERHGFLFPAANRCS
jgi:hypothetical protein